MSAQRERSALRHASIALVAKSDTRLLQLSLVAKHARQIVYRLNFDLNVVAAV
jgi:hypothetical protein